MVLPPKCNCRPSLTFLRNICTHSVLESNYYKALGLSPSATHAEIKSAYYELSKKHHPDKNQGSEQSAKLFRDITQAYEVLGNEKSRKQYDREHSFTRGVGDSFRNVTYRADYSDDIDRIFYERRRKFYTNKQYKQTPYDFEAWYRAHYVTYKDDNFYSSGPRSARSQYQRPFVYRSNPKNYNQPVDPVKKKVLLFVYVLSFFSFILFSYKLSIRKNVKRNS